MQDTYLINVIIKAIIEYKKPVRITCIDRTFGEQQELFKQHKTKTLNSKHLLGKAIDVYVNDGWVASDYEEFATLVKKLDTKKLITWGGDWESFKDCPHFEI